MKETASNIAASAKSGIEKAKAVAQEKMERMTANNPTEKEMATEKKEERVNEAEMKKQEAPQGYSTTGTGKTHSYSTTGATGHPTGAHQMSALPGHGSGQPAGPVVEGVVPSHPIGTATGTQRPSAAHNTRVGGGVNQGSLA
ncbi:hypothetical protein HAX54_000312 [Datura stramonium]|uniref:Uncharacterized protein n=1 Tax=Datura stramonium TaxID=4076 RepID=A0ABS8WS26_DATST|nr:hypothetical protein [Datura stramonium]